MRRTTLSAIQQAAFGTTFSASEGGPPLVRWLPIGRNAYKGLHSSTKPTHTACMTDGREGIGSALPRCECGELGLSYFCCGLNKFTNRRTNLAILLNNSLIQLTSSLFFEKFSLLICLGNCAKSHCSAVVSSYEIGSLSLKIVKFPVKFPVSREFAWRQVRSALRRQPKIIGVKQRIS
jgi:hypothetical protein